MDPHLLLLAVPVITNVLVHIFNLTLITGIIPAVWKTALVSPLHRCGPVNDFNNYHPISKLPCLAKLLEQLVNSQLKMFVSTFNILNLHQSGYRSTHNTPTATTKVGNDFFSALDNKVVCSVIFVDLSKVFDTVDNTLLLKRLETFSFDRKSLNWFKIGQTSICAS